MRISTLFSGLCIALATVTIGLGLVCLANSHNPRLYLIDIFTAPALTAAVGLTALLMVIRQWRPAMISGVGALLLLLALSPQAFPKQAKPQADADPIRLVWANRFMRNPSPEQLLPWIDEKQADIVVLAEVTPQKRDEMLAGLRKSLPYIVERYDMVIASRWPVSHVRAPDGRFALVSVHVKTPAGSVRLAATHLTRPWPFQPPANQQRHFTKLTRYLSDVDGPMVLVGDFNSTPSSGPMTNMAKHLNLHTAPAVLGTWPSNLPAVARINIDNVLATPDLHLSQREVGPAEGSDHNPVYVEIRPAVTR